MPHLPNQPRRPEQGALQQLVRDHFETFRAQAAHLCDGQGLPCFVEQEFRDFLTCGCLAAGFARFRCPDCQLDRAAHLVDHVFPDVPIRQFVLTLPPRLRYLLAWDHTLCRAVAGTTLLTCRTRRRWVAGTRASRGSICMRASWCRPAIAIGWNVCAATRSHPCSLGNARWGPALWPPVGQDRLQLMPDGTAVLELRRRWTDGTTHLVFDYCPLTRRPIHTPKTVRPTV